MDRNRITRNVISLLLLLLFCKYGISQHLREITIIKDTVQEFNKNPSVIQETYVEDGLRLYAVDSLHKIISIGRYKDNKLNGDYFAFYLDVNMPEKKGVYKNDMKSGTWYYWNKKGVLIRTEQWKDDKLISRKNLVK